MLFPAEVAVPQLARYVVVAEVIEPLAGLACERRDDFDAVYVIHQFREHRGLVSRTGAHLENPVSGIRLDEFGHQGDDVGLRNRLPVPDGQRPVLVGVSPLGLRHHAVALHLVHRAEDPVAESHRVII